MIFRLVSKIVKSDCQLHHVCPSACQHGTTRLPIDAFSLNLIFEYFSKICRENPSLIDIGQESSVLYVKTNIHFYHISLSSS